MCGIVGYVGPREATPLLISGLKKLEYRGYDSAGLAVAGAESLQVVRCRGKLAGLETMVQREPPRGTVGVGHTRWATHGRPSEANAHPHRVGSVAVVHNGIIENYLALRARLEVAGRRFLVGDRHRDRRPPHRRGAARGRAVAGGRAAHGAAPGARRLRAGGGVRPAPGPDRRREDGVAAGHRPRQGRDLPGVGRAGLPRAHARGRVSGRRRHRRDHRRRREDHRPRGQPDRAPVEDHHLGRGAGGKGRLPALHAQGDPRAAARDRRHAARAPAPGDQRRRPRGLRGRRHASCAAWCCSRAAPRTTPGSSASS